MQRMAQTYEKGKLVKSEPIGDARNVMDSSAEFHLVRTKQITDPIKDGKKSETVTVWTEGDTFDLANATKAQLKECAENNDIDLGDATTNDEIRKAIKSAG